jgi:hypothetical protein
MQCPRCNTLLEEAAVFCGHCGALLKPQLGSEFATGSDLPDDGVPTVVTRPNSFPSATARSQSSDQIDLQSTVSVDRDPFSGTLNVQQEQRAQPNTITPVYQHPSTPPVHPPLQSGGGRRKLFIFLLLAVVIVGGAIASAILYISQRSASSPATPATGQVSFFDSQTSVSGNTDALKITTSSLSDPPVGYQYNAWLLDTENEQILSLGTLSKSGGSFVLTYSQAGKNLLGEGNQIEITQEQQGQPIEPSGKSLLSATFPPRAFVHIRHLLTQFPNTPGQIGLLVGLLNETQKLNAQAALLQNSLGDGAGHVRQCIAQSMIDIIEGTNGADYSALSGWCATQNIMETGDGFGLLDPGNVLNDRGYIATAAQHAALAANQSDATDLIRNRAKKVEISTDNIRALLQQIKGDAIKLLSNPSDTSQVAEIVSRSDRAYHGFDQNGNDIIQPIMGEAGAITAYTQGQLMATLTLSQ